MDAHSCCRKRPVGRGRGADHQIDVDGIDTGAHQCLLGGGDPQIARQFAIGGDVALFDAGAFGDPVVGGVDDARQIMIRHDAFGQIGTDTPDHGSNHGHVLTSPDVHFRAPGEHLEWVLVVGAGGRISCSTHRLSGSLLAVASSSDIAPMSELIRSMSPLSAIW